MALDRGTLARIDRQVLTELDHADGTQAAKVPVSDAVWSIWRRYCEAIGLTIGEGRAGLIDHELRSVLGETVENDGVFAGRAEAMIVVRESWAATRERDPVAVPYVVTCGIPSTYLDSSRTTRKRRGSAGS